MKHLKEVRKINKDVLLSQFDKAEQNNSDFVYVAIIAEGTKEVILVPNESFENKREFYRRSYTDDLKHVMNKNVKIVDCGMMNSDVFDFIFKGGDDD